MRLIRSILLISIIFIIGGCISSTKSPPYNIAADYNSADINRVGILIIRMGNIFPSQTLPLNPESDFSIKTPGYGWHGKVNDKTQNVYVEDKERLKESFPYYPKTSKGKIRFLTDHYTFEFYKNFSPEIYVMLSETFTEKGYETINIAEMAEAWEKPISESTIGEILDRSKQEIDALAVLQYLDIGTSSLRIGSAASNREGFLNIEYSLYMFNANSKAVIFDCRKDFPAAVIHALLNDPVITENAEYKDKVRKFNKGFGRWNTLYFVNELPKEVNSERLMYYMKNGTKVYSKNFGEMIWTGLINMIPEK